MRAPLVLVPSARASCERAGLRRLSGGSRARRRRWCKGNLQNTFSRDCTLFDSSQPIMLRILWNAVTWHYLTCSVYTPTFLLVPILAILVGIFPIALNRVFALAFTLYFCMQQIVRGPPPCRPLSRPPVCPPGPATPACALWLARRRPRRARRARRRPGGGVALKVVPSPNPVLV
jgi:hypothetical protein